MTGYRWGASHSDITIAKSAPSKASRYHQCSGPAYTLRLFSFRTLVLVW
jgi:hypothetical protein